MAGATDPQSQPTWGVVATIKAPTADTLKFAAYHIDAGAHRVVIYLDAPDPVAFSALKAHPKCRVRTCDAKHWKRLVGHRPQKHQVRQSENATDAYARQHDVDWLVHIDVDEFLVAERGVATCLGAVAEGVQSLRIRPMEMLADGDDTAFKTFIAPGPDRRAVVAKLYPTFGHVLKGGFLSHVAGKVFVRTGLTDLSYRIHNVFRGDDMNPAMEDCPDIVLAHCHSTTWDSWLSHFAYRLDQGSYRSELGPAQQDGETLHSHLAKLHGAGGSDALRSFFQEVAADTPQMRTKLEAQGLLRMVTLDLEAKLARHFPEHVD